MAKKPLEQPPIKPPTCVLTWEREGKPYRCMRDLGHSPPCVFDLADGNLIGVSSGAALQMKGKKQP